VAITRLRARTGIPALVAESPRGLRDPALRAAGRCFAEADVVLLLGKALDFTLAFGEPPAFAPGCRFVRLAPEPGPPRGAGRLALDLAVDPARAADALAEAAGRHAWDTAAWRARVEAAHRAVPEAWDGVRRREAPPVHPLQVCEALRPWVERGAVLVADGGEFGQWVQAALAPATRLINGPAGSIGSGLPLGLAARLACPDRPVFVAVGDGTFGFHAMELDTARRHALPLVVVVGSDGRWNAEYQLQVRRYGAPRAVGCELGQVAHERLAEALGAYAERVDSAAALPAALARAVAARRPACLNVLIEPAAAPAFEAPGPGP
jgi:acetolactate synthase-1/2/3 large subunit